MPADLVNDGDEVLQASDRVPGSTVKPRDILAAGAHKQRIVHDLKWNPLLFQHSRCFFVRAAEGSPGTPEGEKAPANCGDIIIGFSALIVVLDPAIWPELVTDLEASLTVLICPRID